MNIAHDKKSVAQYAKELYRRFKEDEITGLSAQLAYYFLLSIFPFFLFLVSLIAFLPISTGDVLRITDNILPQQSSLLLRDTLTGILETKRGGLLSFGILATIWSASNAVRALVSALNKAYDVEEDRPFWKVRGMSILLTFGVIFAIVVTLALPVLGSLLGYIFAFFGLSSTFILLWHVLRWALSLFILAAVFSILYYFAPNRRLAWKEVWIGGTFTAIGWLIVSFGFSFYVSNFGNYSATYGSLGGVIVLMIWFFLSALIIILGGELNASVDYVNEKKMTREQARLEAAEKERLGTERVPGTGGVKLNEPNYHANDPLKEQLKQMASTFKEESQEMKSSFQSTKQGIQEDVEQWKVSTQPNKLRLKQGINELKQTMKEIKQNKQKADGK